MKKNLLIVFLSIIAALCCALGLTACGDNNGGNPNGGSSGGKEPGEHTCVFIDYVSDNNATCTEDGTKTAKCEFCDKTETITDKDSKLGHSFKNYKSDGNATCTEDGTKTAKCERCNETETIADIDSKLGHSYVNYVSDENATCTEDGTKTAKCERCDETNTITDVNSKLGHSFINYKSDNNATCTEDGTKTAKCERCNETDTVTVEGSYLEHRYENGKCVTCEREQYTSGLTYSLNSDETSYSVTGLGEVQDTYIGIPAEYEGLPVTEIGANAFKNKKLTGVEIPDSVTKIGSSAFYNCDELVRLKIGSGITSIGGSAFYGCKKLKSITIPDGVTSIGVSAFKDCKELASITIPDGVISIGEKAFSSCSSLTSITVEEGNSVYISTGDCLIETESKTLISGCKNSVIPTNGSVTSIGGSAFYGCSGLTSIIIPDRVVSIGDSAFEGCGLTSITIPDGVTAIGEKAFYNCKRLRSLIIGGGVTSISSDAFNYCSSLESITVEEDNSVYRSAGDCLIETESKRLILGCKNSVIPTDGSVTLIGGSAFHGSGITSITIPDGVTLIGGSAFYDCRELASITISDGVISIGNDAFKGTSYYNNDGNWENNVLYICKHLIATKSVISGSYEIKQGTLTIAFSAFEGRSLTSVSIPNSVTHIGGLAFRGCRSLTSVTIGDGVTSIGESAFENCNKLANVNIPDSVTSIGYAAFHFCTALTSVTIGNGVTFIDGYAFRYCSELTSVSIPNSVTSIGERAFERCSKLTSVTIGGGVTSISDFAFYYCSKLTSVTIGNGVTSIGSYAFEGSNLITDIYYNGDIAGWCGILGLRSIMANGRTLYIKGQELTGELVIPEGVTSIGGYAFYYCSELTDITIPDSVTSIGYNAFYGCNNIETAEIPTIAISEISKSKLKTVTITSGEIDKEAFKDCKNITSVTIGSGVTSIGANAFDNCYNLTSVTIGGGVTSIGANAFEDCLITNIYYNGDIAGWCGIFGLKNIMLRVPALYVDGKELTGELVIPEGVTTIADYAFYYRTSITSVSIPAGVTNIGNNTFEYCSPLMSVTIPDSVTTIGTRAFVTSSPIIIYCEATEKPNGWQDSWTTSDRPVIWDCKNNDTDGNGYAYAVIDGIRYSFKEGVVSIAEQPRNITSFTIPETVTYINSEYNVTGIGEYAFMNCTSLTKIIIPDSVTSIGDSAFQGCSALTIYCEATEKPSGWQDSWTTSSCPVIWDCKNNDTDDNGYAYAVIDGIRYSLKDGVATIIRQPKNITSANIPETVTYNNTDYNVTGISALAFDGCHELTSVTIGNGVTSIGLRAFENCSLITSIIIPAGVTTIYGYAFSGCSALTIYCEATTKPSGWDSRWNNSDCTVVWGYTEQE